MKATGDPRPFDISIKDPVARIQAYIDRYAKDQEYTGHESVVMRNIRIISAEGSAEADEEWIARAVFEVTVVPELCNPMDDMHGGAAALLADMATTMAAAPIAKAGFWEFGGVSRTLAVTFIKPIRKGSVARVECTVLSVGSRLSHIRCNIRDQKSRQLRATAEHGKVAVAAQTGVVDRSKM